MDEIWVLVCGHRVVVSYSVMLRSMDDIWVVVCVIWVVVAYGVMLRPVDDIWAVSYTHLRAHET